MYIRHAYCIYVVLLHLYAEYKDGVLFHAHFSQLLHISFIVVVLTHEPFLNVHYIFLSLYNPFSIFHSESDPLLSYLKLRVL